MSKISNTSIIVGVLLVVAAIAVLALRATVVDVEVQPPITFDPGTLKPNTGIVINKLQTGGLELFGLRFGTNTYTLDVQFVAPAGCSLAVVDGDRWPTPIEECGDGPKITGEVTGRGIEPDGESIITVGTEVDIDCFTAVSRGDTWPVAACN